jgi:CRP-like cAMP-binding protein
MKPLVDARLVLRESELFRSLGDDDLAALELQFRRKVFPAGTLLMSPEQPGDSIYVILAGTVKVFLHREDGS